MKGKIVCQAGPTNTYIVATPIGDIEVISCPRGLHSVQHTAQNDENFTPDPEITVAVKSQMYQDNGYTYKPAILCVEWLHHYFTAKALLKAPPVCSSISQSGSFTETVWTTLQNNITFGQVISYGALAMMCGNPKASRAVGAAMKKNNISLIMPCHRVIQGSGKIGNYSGGHKNRIKEWLLQHEGAKI